MISKPFWKQVEQRIINFLKYLPGKLRSIEEKMNFMLDDSKKKAEGILYAAADAIVTYDCETFGIDVFNASAERMFGYQSKE